MAVVAAGVAHALATRICAKPILALGLALMAGEIIGGTQIPVDGTYASDLLAGYHFVGVGIAFVFVQVTIATSAGSSSGPRAALQTLTHDALSFLVPVAFAVAAFVATLLLIPREELAETPATAYGRLTPC